MPSGLIIIGGGPAGLTSALYARRAGITVTVLERFAAGGQMGLTPEIDNYPAVPMTPGYELSSRMEQHAVSQGASIVYADAVSIDVEHGRTAAVVTSNGRLEAGAIIAAMGVRRRELGIEGEQRLSGRGVSYCATCDGGFFKGKTVAVVGGGNTALEDALYLSGLDCTVHLIHRRDSFRGGKLLEERVRARENILLELEQTPTSISGADKVEALTLKNTVTGAVRELPVSAVFAAVGVIPQTGLLKGLVPLGESGHAEAGEDCRTPTPGLFVAGDIRKKPLYQIVTACADGAVAAQEAVRYLEG